MIDPCRKTKPAHLSPAHYPKTTNGKLKLDLPKIMSEELKSDLSEGKYKPYPVIKDGVNAIISKANLDILENASLPHYNKSGRDPEVVPMYEGSVTHLFSLSALC